MIRWKEVTELHVISKIEEIINRWFGSELIFVDVNNKIKSKQVDASYNFFNPFLKVQFTSEAGINLLEHDLENNLPKENAEITTHFDQVLGMVAKIVIDGEIAGAVVAYPFAKNITSGKELSITEQKLKELGVENTQVAINGIKVLDNTQVEYLKNLIEVVACEVVTYHTEISRREDRILELNSELGTKYRYHTMVGKSAKMQKIYQLLEKIANSESSVFIQGENGTGKELVAKAAHFSSLRKDNVFLAVNCSAFNENLLDSELFGHVKGAFTGAIKDKQGLFSAASGGTLFLDEIGDTSLSMQVKLLRVLQEKTYLPVGAVTPLKTDVRIIAATNRDIKSMMAHGEFREDLYYRINVINIQIPPLRDRKEDIGQLIEHFLGQKCLEANIPTKVLSKKCLEKMLDYSWPGNVRELSNEVERMFVLSGDEKIITPDYLNSRILDADKTNNSFVNTQGSLKSAMEELEILMIREGLKRCNFNKSRLSKELGISRASLISKVEKYRLDKRNKLLVNE